MKNILCFGEILWDAFGDTKVAGGAPMNVARHLVQQGANVSFASSVGSDESGKGLVEFLKANGLYSNLIQTDALPTCEVTVQLDAHGHATYIIPQPVSWDNIQPTAALTEAANAASAIVFGSLACRDVASKNTLLGLLASSKALKVFDVNLRPPHYTLSTIEELCQKADVIKMNEDEAELLASEGIEGLENKIIYFQKKYGSQIICVTRGEHGAIVWRNNQFFEHPGFKVQVVDTVGAGDSFLATFISGILNDTPMDKTIEKACKIGGFVASKRGANPVYDESVKSILNNE